MADLSLEVCRSVGAGQKWDRVETADEADLNLEVLCLWVWDRGLGPGPTYMSELYISISTLQVAHFAQLLALVSSKPNISKARLMITQTFALCEDCDFIDNCCNIFSSHFCNNIK